MNCKQGDLAVVVRLIPVYNFYRQHIGNINACGAIVQCAKLERAHDGNPMWELAEPVDVKVTLFHMPAEDGMLIGIGDEYLKPIGNPGDDAKDESHAWLPPVPVKEVAHG